MTLNVTYEHKLSTSSGEGTSVRVPLDDLTRAYGRAASSLEVLQFDLSDDDRREVLELYNAMVVDGRYIRDFIIDPRSVARTFDMPISDAAADAIVRAGQEMTIDEEVTTEAFAPVAIVAIAIVVIFIAVQIPVPADEQASLVVDSSGVVKL
jgi:hypothetical protein